MHRYLPIAVVVAVGLASFPSGLRAADEPVVEQLRIDVRTLEREVRELTRRLGQLEASPAQPVVVPRRPERTEPAAALPSAPWLRRANWDRVRPGMSADDVIAVLGPPTASRMEGMPPVRTLFYTLEIAEGAFLSGRIRLQQDRVADIELPVLR